MLKAKRLLSILLVASLMISTFVFSNFVSNGAETVYFQNWQTSNINSNNNEAPEKYFCDNDGSVKITSPPGVYRTQRQLLFNADQTMIANALKVAQDEKHSGLITMCVSVEKCVAPNGSSWAPGIEILLSGPNGQVASSNVKQACGTRAYYKLNVRNCTAADITSIKLAVQCYNYNPGCANLSVVFYPLTVVDNEVTTTLPPKSTIAIPEGVDTATLFQFRAAAKNKDYGNAPSGIYYSADSATWKNENQSLSADGAYDGYVELDATDNNVEQAQLCYAFPSADTNQAELALALANNEGGSGKAQLSVMLNACYDSVSNQECIAEIVILIGTQEDPETGKKPDTVKLTAWQYPGTTRTYYLDISKIENTNQLSNVIVQVQNYWYYDENHNLVDPNVVGYGTITEKGYKKCMIRPDAVFSPITIVPASKADQAVNVDSNFSLNGYNSNGGTIPEDITDPQLFTTTATSTTASSVTPSAPSLKSVSLTAKTSSKITWAASKNAKSYNVYRKIGSGSYSCIKSGITGTSYTNTKLAASKKYTYAVKAVNGSKLSSYSNAKSITTMSFSSKVAIKSLAKTAKKTVKVTLQKKITGATGYKIQYATNKKFKSAKTVYTTTLTKTIKKLASNKTYYFRAYAYKTVNGKKAVAKVSTIKYTKTK